MMVCFPLSSVIRRSLSMSNQNLGMLSSLKNVKKDVTEMRKGQECGIGFANWTDFQVGDLVQCYDETSERRTL